MTSPLSANPPYQRDLNRLIATLSRASDPIERVSLLQGGAADDHLPARWERAAFNNSVQALYDLARPERGIIADRSPTVATQSCPTKDAHVRLPAMFTPFPTSIGTLARNDTVNSDYVTYARSRSAFRDAKAQGWRLIIGATPDNAADVAKALIELIATTGFRFHMARTLDVLVEINNGRRGFGHIGHFAIVELSETGSWDFVGQCRQRMVGLRSPRALKDQPVPGSENLSLSWGAFYDSYPRLEPAETAIVDPAGHTAYMTAEALGGTWRPPFVPLPPPLANAHPAPASPGLIRDRYLILELLKIGSCGFVFLALDLGARSLRPCIVKHYRYGLGADRKGYTGFHRADREAAILALAGARQFGAPRLIDRFELGEDRFLVLEHITGLSLDALIDATPELMPSHALWSLTKKVAAAIDALHGQGIRHRDIKPDNIMMAQDGRVHLIDFSLACMTNTPADQFMGTGSLGYRPSYASTIARDPGKFHDFYGFGVTIAVLASGLSPVAFNEAGTPIAIDPRRDHDFIISLSAGERRLVERCLSKSEMADHSLTEIVEAEMPPPIDGDSPTMAAMGVQSGP